MAKTHGLFRTLLLLTLFCVWGQAQDVGRISGTVQDPTGAVIPGATEAATGFARSDESEPSFSPDGVRVVR